MNDKRYQPVIFLFLVLVLICSTAALVGADCSSDMAAYWKLDETTGNSYFDVISGQDGTCTEDCPAPIQNGRISGAQQFNGYSTGIEIPANIVFNWSSNDSFTIELWFKRSSDNFSGAEIIIGRNDFATSSLNWWIGLNSAGNAKFTLQSTDGNSSSLNGLATLTDDTWHHLAAVRDALSNQIILYVDGKITASTNTVYVAGFDSAIAPITVGRLNTSPFYHFGGIVDEIGIHNRALTDVEIKQHYYDGHVGMAWGYCGCNRPVRIMPLGDSITNGYIFPEIGYEFRVGYRQKLYFDLIDIGYEHDFVGSLNQGSLAYPQFDFDNEGHGGFTSYEIAGSVFGWLQNNPPDIVLLHVGTNNLQSSALGIDMILDEIDRFSEDITVVLAKIINWRDYNPIVSVFNSNIEVMVTERIANGDKIILVDQEQALLYPDDFADDIHPYLTGYQKMAGGWLEGLLKILPVCGEVFPIIYSSPHKMAIVGVPYFYAVKASGNPEPNFFLLDAPVDMAVDEDTGLLEWVPQAAGAYDVSILADNRVGSVSQNFQIQVNDHIINDNGGTDTSFTGSWELSSGPDYYGTQSVFNKDQTGGTYTYTSASALGPTRINLWWTSTPTRCSSVPVEIYDGETRINTVHINQQVKGGQWNYLGTYEVTDRVRVVIISEGDSCSTNADAVEFVTDISPSLDFVHIEGPAAVSANSDTPYMLKAYYTDGTNRLAAATNWEIDCLEHATISSAGILSTNEIDSDTLCRITAGYTEEQTTRYVSKTVSVSADKAEVVIDDGDAGTSAVGNWYPSGGEGFYGSQSLYNREAGGGRYAFESPLSGTSEIDLWWTVAPTRCSDVPVEIYDGSTLVESLRVNQKVDGGQWIRLGSYAFSGTARVVVVSRSEDCSACADAVRFVGTTPAELDAIEIEGPVTVNDNASTVFHVRAVYADGSSRLVTAGGWAVDCTAYASLSDGGVLTTMDVLSDELCQVSASYSEGGVTRTALLQITIADKAEVVIDDGGAGTSAVGNWYPSGGEGFYGSQSLYNREAGGGRYAFESPLSGTSEIDLWWTVAPTRCSDVPVEIYDGSTLVESLRVNQKVDGGQWNRLGSYAFSGTARVVVVSRSEDCSACADAVRFVGTTPAELDAIEIEGPVTVNDNASTVFHVRAVYADGSSRLITAGGWAVDCTAYASLSDGGVLTTMDVLSDELCQVSASYSEGGVTRTALLQITIADKAEVVIDDGDAGTSAVGNWYPSGGEGFYGSQSLYNREAGGGRYAFESPLSGTSEIDLWWTVAPTRCSDVPVEIYDGSTLVESLRVNQKVDGGQWNRLGSYAFSGTARVVVVSRSEDCSACADAVRFVGTTPAELDAIEIEGPVTVNDNASTVFHVRAVYADGSSRLVTAGGWAVDCTAYASLSDGGVLTTMDVLSDELCQVSASYSEGGVTRTALLQITIADKAEVVIDDGDAGTSAVGNWYPSGGEGFYGSQSLYNREAGGGRYAFESPLSGTSEIDLWWTVAPTRCSDVPVEIYDGSTLVESLRVNQKVDGGQWNRLGSYAFSGTARVVVVSRSEDCSACADAVRFVGK